MNDHELETIHHKWSMESTERFRIDGGWLYRTRVRNSGDLPDSLALTFVPDRTAPEKGPIKPVGGSWAS